MLLVEQKIYDLVVHRKLVVDINIELTIDCSTSKSREYRKATKMKYEVTVEGARRALVFIFYPQDHTHPHQKSVEAVNSLFEVELAEGERIRKKEACKAKASSKSNRQSEPEDKNNLNETGIRIKW